MKTSNQLPIELQDLLRQPKRTWLKAKDAIVALRFKAQVKLN